MCKGKDISNYFQSGRVFFTLAEISLTFSAGRQVYFKGRQNLTELKFFIKGKTFLQTKQTTMASQLVNLLNVPPLAALTEYANLIGNLSTGMSIQKFTSLTIFIYFTHLLIHFTHGKIVTAKSICSVQTQFTVNKVIFCSISKLILPWRLWATVTL